MLLTLTDVRRILADVNEDLSRQQKQGIRKGDLNQAIAALGGEDALINFHGRLEMWVQAQFHKPALVPRRSRWKRVRA